jgi:hypothetical protein
MAKKPVRLETPVTVVVADKRSDPPKRKALPREELKADGYFSIYANDLLVQTSIWDVRIKLGEVVADNSTTLKVKTFGEVRLAPQLAKKLTMMLLKQLQDYEDKYGPIPMLQD